VDRIVVFAGESRGAGLYDIGINPALREANGSGARNRARGEVSVARRAVDGVAKADGNSPDEMSGRYGEVVRRTQARLSVPMCRQSAKRRQISGLGVYSANADARSGITRLKSGS
jgi:hypothetical protein